MDASPQQSRPHGSTACLVTSHELAGLAWIQSGCINLPQRCTCSAAAAAPVCVLLPISQERFTHSPCAQDAAQCCSCGAVVEYALQQGLRCGPRPTPPATVHMQHGALQLDGSTARCGLTQHSMTRCNMAQSSAATHMA